MKPTVQKSVTQFLQSLRQRNASVHTIKAYSGDLAEFTAYIGSRGLEQIDHLAIRGFLSHLYEKGLGKTSVARALAAVRSLYRWLAQEGVVEQNPASLVSTPKLSKKLPRVPTIEEMNGILNGNMPEVAAFPERDRLMFELLYGCGIRNSELTGINLEDIRLSAEAILIRGKGKKERYVPFGDSVKTALGRLPAGPPEGIGRTEEKCPGIIAQLARRPPHHPQCGTDRQKNCRRQGLVAGSSSAYASPCLRNPYAGRRRRPARDSGDARPRASFHHPALYPAFHQARSPRLRPDPSPGKMTAFLMRSEGPLPQ